LKPALGPLVAVVLTLDLHLTLLFLVVNTAFGLGLTLLLFRKRPVLDQLLILLGLVTLTNLLGLVGTYLYARAPVREVQAISVD